MMLGERDAFDLGVEVGRVRITVFVAASLLVGASVASSGSVGYVGLVVPHLVRLSFGSDNRIVIAASALAGAAFVIMADTVAQTIIVPRELPVGAITALIGAPFRLLAKTSVGNCAQAKPVSKLKGGRGRSRSDAHHGNAGALARSVTKETSIRKQVLGSQRCGRRRQRSQGRSSLCSTPSPPERFSAAPINQGAL